MLSIFKTSRKGFGLIELSFILIIASLIMIAIFLRVGSSSSRLFAAYSKTNKTLDEIERSLLNFVAENGRLPCPASLFQDTAQETFGVERVVYNEELQMNRCEAGNSIGISEFNASELESIYQGAIPVRTLKLPDNIMFDEWNNKIEYAVQTSFINNNRTNRNASIFSTDNNTDRKYFSFRSQAKGSDVPDDDDLLIQNLEEEVIANSAVYFLFSHGKNSYNAVARKSPGNGTEDYNGNYIFPANPNNNSPENRNGAISTPNHIRYYSAYVSNPEFFDDIARFKGRDQLIAECNDTTHNMCEDRWDLHISTNVNNSE